MDAKKPAQVLDIDSYTLDELHNYVLEFQKQQYLKYEIIEGGYSQEGFAKFMDQKNPGQQLDVNLYSWEGLQEIVIEY